LAASSATESPDTWPSDLTTVWAKTKSGAKSSGGSKLSGPILNVAYQPQLQYQWSSNPTGNGKGINDFYGSVALGAYMWITPELSINANVSLDQVDSPSNPDQWAFYGEGIQAGDIWIEWTDQRTGIIAGRFTSLFGLAPRLLPGVFDTNIVNNYSFGGLLGVQGSLSTGDEGGGIHSLNVEGFGVDTTFLSGSVITPTPKPTGPGTGGGMDSFCINYTGANIPFIFPTLQVSASYIQFGTGNGVRSFGMMKKTVAEFGPVAASKLASEMAAALEKAAKEVGGGRNPGYQG
jgi:hypothetical protein